MALVLCCGNVFADSMDSDKATAEPGSDPSQILTTVHEKSGEMDMLEICPPPSSDKGVLPELKTEMCESEPVEAVILLDGNEESVTPDFTGGEILVRPKADSLVTRTSTHTAPWKTVNPIPALVVFHDDNRKDDLFYGALYVTVQW